MGKQVPVIYATCDGNYICELVDVTDKSTWLLMLSPDDTRIFLQSRIKDLEMQKAATTRAEMANQACTCEKVCQEEADKIELWSM